MVQSLLATHFWRHWLKMVRKFFTVVATATVSSIITYVVHAIFSVGRRHIFDVVPPCTHRQTYIQMNILKFSRIFISSHRGCPTVTIKRVVDKQPSFGTSTTTSYVEKAPDSLEAEVCISAESIPTLKNHELIHFDFCWEVLLKKNRFMTHVLILYYITIHDVKWIVIHDSQYLSIDWALVWGIGGIYCIDG